MLMGGPKLGADGVGPDGTRRCLSCDEVVAPHAIACRHCGASLVDSDPFERSDDPSAFENPFPERPARREPRPGPPGREAPGGDTPFHGPQARDPQARDPQAHDPQAHDPQGPTSRGGDTRTGAGRRAGPGDARERRRSDGRGGPSAAESDDSSVWSDSDFERISQTAGLPREDPRQRHAAGTRRGATGRRWRPTGDYGLDRMWTRARTARPNRLARWLVSALVLVVIGAGAGWLAGRWDAGSWIGRQYTAAAEVLHAITTAPQERASGTAPSSTPPLASTPAPAPTPAPDSGASAGIDRTETPTAGTPQDSTVVDPRPVTPAPRPATRDGTGSRTASLVPIRPSDGAEAPSSSTNPSASGSATGESASAAPSATGSGTGDAQPTKPWSVLDVQRELARLGYYSGGLDGQVGPMTREAVRNFQQDAGLRPTGRIEPTLVTALANRTTEGPNENAVKSP